MRSPATAALPPAPARSDFYKFWAGQTVSNFGSAITGFALPLIVHKRTGSALNLGIATAVTFVPYLLFGLVLGAWADRVDRKRLMIGTDLARGALIASVPLLALAGDLPVWWLYMDRPCSSLASRQGRGCCSISIRPACARR